VRSGPSNIGGYIIDPKQVSRSRASGEIARRKLARLMPFDEWCDAINPTDTAKELYVFVRRTLEDQLEQSRRAATLPRRPATRAAGPARDRSAARMR
jgi:hypothetical protein